jgi:hypothetical protein
MNYKLRTKTIKRTDLKYFLLFLILLITACDIFEPRSEPETMNAQEHLIILTVLDSALGMADTAYIDNGTMTNIDIESMQILLNLQSVAYDASVLNNYRKANQETYLFNKDLLPENVVLEERDTNNIYTGNFCFSRPGISNDGQYALVEFHRISAPLSGGGYAAFLIKQDGLWRLHWYDMIWIS